MSKNEPVSESVNVAEVPAGSAPIVRKWATHLVAFAGGAAVVTGMAFGGLIPTGSAPTASSGSTASVQKVVRSVSGKDADTMKREATEKLTQVLKSIAETADPNGIGDEVSAGNYEHVPEILKNSVVGETDASKQASMVAVIYLAAGLGNAMGGAQNIAPISDQAVLNTAEAITESGTVHIPQSIYVRTKRPVSVSMVYYPESNEWKIDGFTLMLMEVSAAVDQQNSATASAPASASSDPKTPAQ